MIAQVSPIADVVNSKGAYVELAEGRISAMLNADWINRVITMGSKDRIERCQTMIVAGNKLEIIATRIWEDEWSLCIRNIHGIRTEWTEFFECADDALATGRQALESEDVETFISKEGFDYLP